MNSNYQSPTTRLREMLATASGKKEKSELSQQKLHFCRPPPRNFVLLIVIYYFSLAFQSLHNINSL